ncbi:MAG: hypothetical protein OXI83_09370 [Gemmatimonadota bacterium]|nr:hypothetical protein [Gemmatimonadota bacterium]
MKTHGKYLLLLAGILLATSCVDDPVAVADVPLHLQTADSDRVAARDDDEGASVDYFRSRFAVTMEVDGELAPDETVTLRIEGVATEKILSGEVRLMLPTMAAMDHAGADKRPNFPLGKELPVIASWTLATMDEGDNWKRSVAVELPEKGGYYHVAVDVDAVAPDDKWNSYVLDGGRGEAWLLVVGGGGQVMDEFDESVFDDDVVPQPGPFRTKYESRAPTSADVAASAAGAGGGAAYVGLLVGYYQGSNFRSASGARVQAMYLDPGESYGTVIIRDVGGSGLITFPCPEAEDAEYMAITASVPNTTEVNGNHVIGNTQADQDDCGTTHLMIISDRWYLPWLNLTKAIPRIDDHLNQSRSAVDYKYSSSNDDAGGKYSPYHDEITFFSGGYFSLKVAAHEYGHALHHESLGGSWSASNCDADDRRTPWVVTSYKCAFKEGFADYTGAIGRQQPTEWERLNYTTGIPGKIEGHVAALFTDLIDSSDEGDDETNYPGYYVSEVFRTCRVNGSKRNDVSDFVWCLENRVNEIVHNSNFPGISAPDNPTEGASEPSDWDADDVRRTWIQNVGY